MWNCIPSLRQRTLKMIPWLSERPYIGNIWEYSPPPPPRNGRCVTILNLHPIPHSRQRYSCSDHYYCWSVKLRRGVVRLLLFIMLWATSRVVKNVREWTTMPPTSGRAQWRYINLWHRLTQIDQKASNSFISFWYFLHQSEPAWL